MQREGLPCGDRPTFPHGFEFLFERRGGRRASDQDRAE
jgi:hypothetical protein